MPWRQGPFTTGGYKSPRFYRPFLGFLIRADDPPLPGRRGPKSAGTPSQLVKVNSAGGRIDVSACLGRTGSPVVRASAGADGIGAEMAGKAVAVIGYDTALCSSTDSGGGAIVTARPGTSRLCTQN